MRDDTTAAFESSARIALPPGRRIANPAALGFVREVSACLGLPALRRPDAVVVTVEDRGLPVAFRALTDRSGAMLVRSLRLAPAESIMGRCAEPWDARDLVRSSNLRRERGARQPGGAADDAVEERDTTCEGMRGTRPSITVRLTENGAGLTRPVAVKVTAHAAST
jgi:hypothetical protein